jgi:hypothetical protein
MRATESFQAQNVAAGTFGPWFLEGGTYELALSCTGTPACALSKLMPDGTTYVDQYGRPNTATPGTYIKSLITADKLVFPDLAPGQYKVVISTSTANYLSLTRVPNSE